MTQTSVSFSQLSKSLLLRNSFPVPSPLFQDVTDALGMVPIVRMNRIHPLCEKHDFYLKLESCNPGGSIKEKNAAYLIGDAEEKGLLQRGGTIVESSSGNFGIGLAIVGAARGYRVMVVIDAKTSPTIRQMLQVYGAELIEVPLSAADAQGSMQIPRMEKAKALASEIPGAWYPCQHENPTNPNAHAHFTAREIEAAFQGTPDAIAIGVSTAGQLGGIGRFFKQRYPKTRIIGVDVAGSAIFGTPRHPYKMTGLGLSFVPPNFDPEMLDGAYCISDQIAFSVCHALAREEGLLLGASTGAIVAAALADAQQFTTPQQILLLNPDRGDRYLETMYNPDWLTQQGITILQRTELIQTIESLKSIPLTVVQGSIAA
ncbi:MAG TPA: cysteine synthase [Cyanobacteria bacterium UBA11149]|nr:cysteine synthase [Cyanobacteria bacterium UBA11367]HBE60350.1 cysteine synthase [Cyanobacteria bacterium UBA11366]HBK66638.1 cysteine synthase [Cyanobacteria bacterium UBA11166]HBR75408.1 cysteine synthase [Cyanobacteria bacterium UBA11159]HBS71852.1 cysteine synthase [Cyanobacteria bacterium UBA11153]HBW89672.1 cysteine synthase [Cyanobacteria bacterium UBA11149]HCA97050.1 cysteine synthase [Cyanobacteria bacterium UBA9226]